MQTVLNAGLMMVIYDKTFRTISYILKFVQKNELNVKWKYWVTLHILISITYKNQLLII
jgi:hypothetical protein